MNQMGIAVLNAYSARHELIELICRHLSDDDWAAIIDAVAEQEAVLNRSGYVPAIDKLLLARALIPQVRALRRTVNELPS